MNPPRLTDAGSSRRAARTAGLVCLALLGAGATGALAGPPPGHPSPGAAMQMIRPGGVTNALAQRTGVALDAIDANDYTYIEVDDAGKSYWIAAPRLRVARGDMVQFDEGVVMNQFYSKALQRTFPSVMFVGGVSTTPGGR